jgi:uncharacterized protein (DUF2236 family)
MQVAHPLVAAGVSAHSDYRQNPWQRLERTMSAVWKVVYGTRAEADRAAGRVRSLHSRVYGVTPEPMGPFPAGSAYSAANPDLLMWVHATLVDTALLVYEGWVRPLSDTERGGYYEDMKVLARLFGTPEHVIPPTIGDFHTYMRERLASEEIAVTPAALDVMQSVLRPPLPLPLRPAWRAVALVTAALLPPRLREQYGLRWDPIRGAAIAASREWTRRVVLPLLPDMLRAIPPARANHLSVASQP